MKQNKPDIEISEQGHFRTQAQWQPIESAPEGIALLTYEFDKDIGDGVEISTYAFDGVWDCRGYKRGAYRPTHWMPLPTPPKESEDV